MTDEMLSIHGCQDARRAGDVVFVHGLNGNARHYWCHEGTPENYWPAWVAEALPTVGVWSLGYENAAFQSRRASLLGRSGYRGFAMPLSDRAKHFHLQLENRGIGRRPIVFVAHSMGGLLVKQLLRAANERPNHESWNAVLKNTRGVCFIATPHIGSDLAKWASYFRALLGTNVSIEQLRPHDSLLLDLNESFFGLVARPGANIKVLSFVEKRPLIGDLLVVAQGDATLHVPGGTVIPLNEDHLSICKPRSNHDDIHVKLVNFIGDDCLRLAPRPVAPERPDALDPPPWRPGPLPASETASRRPPTRTRVAIACGLIVCGLIAAALVRRPWAARPVALPDARAPAGPSDYPPFDAERPQPRPNTTLCTLTFLNETGEAIRHWRFIPEWEGDAQPRKSLGNREMKGYWASLALTERESPAQEARAGWSYIAIERPSENQVQPGLNTAHADSGILTYDKGWTYFKPNSHLTIQISQSFFNDSPDDKDRGYRITSRNAPGPADRP